MRNLLWAWLGIALLLTSSAAAQEEQPARIARLIRNLGSSSYNERTEAAAEIARLGSATRQPLEAAAAGDDAEVRLRARQLLDRLRVDDLWEPTRVTLHAEQAPASELLSRLAQSGATPLLVGDQFGALRDQPATAAFDRAPFFQVLDNICRQTGNVVRPHYDQRNPGLVIAAGNPGAFPLAYSGPIRGRITSARRVFIEEIDYDAVQHDTTHTFQFNLQLSWESQFRLAAYRSQVEVLDAATDDGQRLSGLGSGSSEWKAVSPSNRAASMTVRLQPPPISSQKLSHLRLQWELLAVGDMQTLEVDDLRPGVSHWQDDLELTVAAIDSSMENRHDLTLLIKRDLVVPEPRDVLYQENEFELVDRRGRPFRKQINNWRWTDEGLRVQASFTPDAVHREAAAEDRRPAQLRFTYPRIRSQRGLEIVFEDVPLPTRRPE